MKKNQTKKPTLSVKRETIRLCDGRLTQVAGGVFSYRPGDSCREPCPVL